MISEYKKMFNFKNTRKYIYIEDERYIVKRLVFFGVTWPLLWFVYLYNRKQFILLITLSVVIAALYYIFSNIYEIPDLWNTMYFWIVYFFYTSLIVCTLSTLIFIRQKKKYNIKRIVECVFNPVFKSDFELKKENDEEYTKILIVPFLENPIVVEPSRNKNYEEIFYIKLTSFTYLLDYDTTMELSKKIINKKPQKILVDIDQSFYSNNITNENKVHMNSIRRMFLTCLTYQYLLDEEHNYFKKAYLVDEEDYKKFLTELHFNARNIPMLIWDIQLEKFLRLILFSNYNM